MEVLGARLGRVELREPRTHVGYIDPCHPPSEPLRVRDVVRTGLTNSVTLPPGRRPTPEQRERADRLIETLGLTAHRDPRSPRAGASGP